MLLQLDAPYDASLPGAMEQGGDPMALGLMVVIGAAALGFALLGALILIKQLRCICRPNEVLIFTGREYRQPDGTTSKTDVIVGGGRWRWPIIEEVNRMDITTMPIKVPASAYSKGGIQLKVEAIANIKVSSDQRYVRNAIERFLGRDRAEVGQVARQTLEGNLRGVLAKLTPEEVNEDRLRFSAELTREAGRDLAKLGLGLDTLKIQQVSDDVEYLDSIGRKRVAEIVKEAEVAESDAEREAKTATSQAKAEGDVAREEAQKVVLEANNNARRIRAECEARVEAEIKRTEAAAQAARALAEQELQRVRREVARIRLQVEVVVPAEAHRQARELTAKGDAAPLVEQGRAVAESLQMLAAVWGKAGANAREVFLIQQLEGLMRTVVDSVKKIEIKEVSLLDGGDGQALPSYVASFPATVNAVLSQLRTATGVDIPGVLAGEGRLGKASLMPGGQHHG